MQRFNAGRAQARPEFLAFFSQGRHELQFEVNGQDYYCNFEEEDSRWYVFAHSATGVQKIPVYADMAKYDRIGVLDLGRSKIPN